jgi:hypothetical protein
MILQIATALAVGFYVVLARDVQPKRLDATPRRSFQHSADHFVNSACLPAPSARPMTKLFRQSQLNGRRFRAIAVLKILPAHRFRP